MKHLILVLLLFIGTISRAQTQTNILPDTANPTIRLDPTYTVTESFYSNKNNISIVYTPDLIIARTDLNDHFQVNILCFNQRKELIFFDEINMKEGEYRIQTNIRPLTLIITIGKETFSYTIF